MLVQCFNLNNIPHDSESCVNNFSVWGFQLSLSSIMPRYFEILCCGWWLIETEKLILLWLFMSMILLLESLLYSLLAWSQWSTFWPLTTFSKILCFFPKIWRWVSSACKTKSKFEAFTMSLTCRVYSIVSHPWI